MYKNIFKKDLQDFLQKNSYSTKIVIDYSDYEDYHYQSPLLFGLKKEKTFQPQSLVDFLNSTGHYSQVQLTGKGFLSVKVNLEQEIPHKIKKKNKVLIDYCGVNVAKQMHIGHIRSMFIGDFIVRTHEKLDDDVITYNHIGDWGNQFGFLLQYIIENNLEIKDNKELTQFYKNSYSLYKENKDFAQRSIDCAHALHHHQPLQMKLWQQCVNISLKEAENIFTLFDLKINLSHTQGESFYATMCPMIEKELIDKKIAQEQEDGSVLIFFEKDESPLILKKSSGSYLYAMYDLAAIKWRMDNICPDKMIYVVDKRQSLHFKQIFSVAQKMQWINHDTCLHTGFGTILGQDKKPLKTKSGDALYLDILLAEGKEQLSKNEHFVKMNTCYKEEILQKTLIGALKYYDLKFSRQQDYVFDWEHVLNIKGNSAPYLQNAYVRIDSILYKKYGMEEIFERQIDFAQLSDLGKEIYFNCQKTHELLEDFPKEEYPSHMLTQHVMKQCQLFHAFYEKEKILGADNEKNNLALLTLLKNNFEYTSNILGISLYECEPKLKQKTEQKNALPPKNFLS